MKYFQIVFIIPIYFLSTLTFSQESLTSSNVKVNDSLIKAEMNSLIDLVRVSYFEKKYGQTIDLAKRTLSKSDSFDYDNNFFFVRSLLGNAFLAIQDTLQAKRTFSDSRKLAQKIKDSSALIINSIDLGNVYLLQNNTKRAIEIYEQTIPVVKKRLENTQLSQSQKSDLRINLFVLNHNIAEISLDEKAVKKARIFVEQTRNYYHDSLFAGYKAGYYYNEGRLLALQNDIQGALIKLATSDSLARSIGFTEQLIDISNSRINYERELGNIEVVNDLLIDLDSLKSEKYKADRIIAVETATAQFKVDQFKNDLKNQELESEIEKQKLKKEATQFWILIALFIISVASIILLFSYLKRKKLLKNLISKNKQYLAEKEKTEALSKAKTILFSNIAHELRTPAYGIVGLSDAIKRPEEKKNFKENVQALQYSAYYLRSLINNILFFNKVDEIDGYKLDNFEFNLREVVANAIESSRHFNNLESNEYNVIIDKNIPLRLRGDEVKLSQILINLISNATKFTTRGLISISALLESKNKDTVTVKFIIGDTGIGIDEKSIPHLFNEFDNIDINQKTSTYRLGLPIVKKLLDAHGAKIVLVSKINKGTEVSFKIDYGVVPENIEKKIALNTLDSDLEKPFEGKNFLVVDDNKINLLVTQKTLSRLGGKTILANSGQEALIRVKETKFDLIFMDINMPDMDGFETSEHIRLFDNETPIVALTAVDLHSISERNRDGLLNNFIIKPYPLEDLIATVNHCLQ